MKYFGGEVFGFSPVSDPLHHIGIHALEVDFVKVGKQAGSFCAASIRSRSSASFFRAFNEFSAVLVYTRVNAGDGEKVTGREKLRLNIFKVALPTVSCIRIVADGATTAISAADSRRIKFQFADQREREEVGAKEVTYGSD